MAARTSPTGQERVQAEESSENAQPPAPEVPLHDSPREADPGLSVHVALFVTLLPFAFSYELGQVLTDLTNWSLLQQWWAPAALDLVFLSYLLFAIRHIQGGQLRDATFAAWALAAVVTVALDVVLTGPHPLFVSLLASLAYVAALAVIVALVLDIVPWRALAPRHRDRFRPAVPLLTGTLAAYVAMDLWDYTIERQDDGVIEAEYFAQVSQIIPLLLVALAIESNVFRRFTQGPTQQAVLAVTVAIIAVGELLAISVLPGLTSIDGKSGLDLADPWRTELMGLIGDWHQFTAFIVSFNAITVALTTLVWGILMADNATPGPADPPMRGNHVVSGPANGSSEGAIGGVLQAGRETRPAVAPDPGPVPSMGGDTSTPAFRARWTRVGSVALILGAAVVSGHRLAKRP